MSFLESLGKSKSINLLAGAAIRAKRGGERKWQMGVELTGSSKHYVKLAVHYGSQVLSRFPKTESRGYQMASELERMINLIVNEGVWPDSNLIRYADADGVVELMEAEAVNGGEILNAGLIVPSGMLEPTLVFEEPVQMSDEGLIYSVIGLWQVVVNVLDNEGVEKLDRVLRYFNSYLSEGISPTDGITAQTLANRALREAGVH